MVMQTEKGLTFHILGDGPEAVMCHASLGLGRFLFHRVAPRWASRYTVVTWDPRGIGDNRSMAPSMEGLVEDARDILVMVDRPTHLVGVSLGSFIMARVAAEGDPRIATVALVSTTLGFRDGLKISAQKSEEIFAVGMAEYARRYAKAVLTEFCSAEVSQNLYEEMADVAPGAYIETMKLTYQADNGPIFAEVSQPTLVVVGTLDDRTPPAEAELAARVLPNSWLAVVPRAGHLIPLDQPTRLDEILQEFWQS